MKFPIPLESHFEAQKFDIADVENPKIYIFASKFQFFFYQNLDFVLGMLQASLPIVAFEDVRPGMHFRLRDFDSNSPRFVKRTCVVESYRHIKRANQRDEIYPLYHEEFPVSSVRIPKTNARRQQLHVLYQVPLPSGSLLHGSLLRKIYSDQMWDDNLITRGVMVRGQIIDLSFTSAQKNLLIAIRHGLLNVIETILEFGPTGLMFQEIHRYYRSDEQAGFALGVSTWITRNGRKSQSATPWQWANIFGRQEVIRLFDARMRKPGKKKDLLRYLNGRKSLKKNFLKKVFGYLARCEFWVKLRLRFWIFEGYVEILTKFGAKLDFRVYARGELGSQEGILGFRV